VGLACHLLGIGPEGVRRGGGQAGRLFETFVVLELRKQASWAENLARVHHFRSRTGQEGEVVLECGRGEVVGIETKLSATPSPRDFSGRRALREHLGKKFIRGVLIHTGLETIPFAEDLCARPVTAPV